MVFRFREKSKIWGQPLNAFKSVLPDFNKSRFGQKYWTRDSFFSKKNLQNFEAIILRWISNCHSFLKGANAGLFFYIFVFSIKLTVNVQYKFLCLIRTADLWSRKQPLYQLSHNHCPPSDILFLKWAIPGLFFVYCRSFQTKSIQFYNKLM